MPVWAFLDELRLVRLGLRNYWGYNPYAFMAPDPRYARGRPDGRVPRHGRGRCTGPGSRSCSTSCSTTPPRPTILGPTLSLRGLDNATYYRLDPADPSRYLDWAGCGNSLNLGHPRVLQLAMDALRHWAGAGRRRLPLRPRPALGRDRAGGFAPDARAAAGDRPGPGAGRPEADRRALGPRAGRLPAGPVPAAVRDVERPLPRLRAPVLARRRGDAAGARRAAARLGRPLRGRRPPPLGQRQPRHQP